MKKGRVKMIITCSGSADKNDEDLNYNAAKNSSAPVKP
jgi:hypothetical protein